MHICCCHQFIPISNDDGDDVVDDDVVDDDDDDDDDVDDDDDYLGEGMNREGKGRRGASIGTEVKRSRDPENFSPSTS